MTRPITPVSFLLIILLFFTTASLAHTAPVVLFDQGHGQKFLVGQNQPLDISNLAGLFAAEGAVIRTTRDPISEMVLYDVDVLIVSGPFMSMDEDEINTVIQFLNRGGRLAVMAHISDPLGPLLKRLNIRISAFPVGEQENVINANPRDFTLTRLAPHPLTRDLAGINVYGGWALLQTSKDTTVIARTTDRAWLDLNQDGKLNKGDAVQSFGMILAGSMGKGYFAVFGDDAIFQNQFLKDGNLVLARNLVKWFIGERQLIYSSI